jgi:putative hydrolase of the HAD superfamily
MKSVKLIGFDLDDCLFDSTGLSAQSRVKGIDAMISLGLEVEKSKAIQLICEVVNEYGSNSSKHFNYFLRRLNHTEGNVKKISYNDRHKFIAAAVMAYHEEKVKSIKLYDDVEECLAQLNNLSIKTSIITDGIPIKQYEKILRLDLDKKIDLIVISDEIGFKKPNPELFNFWLKKFGIKGNEAIYIGDRIDKDIVPANINHINTVYIHRGGKYDINHGEIDEETVQKPNYEISSLDELFKIIDDINGKT